MVRYVVWYGTLYGTVRGMVRYVIRAEITITLINNNTMYKITKKLEIKVLTGGSKVDMVSGVIPTDSDT
jgi:hypothetical protein